jgi:predicted GNAT family N-acyltransferase
MEQSIKNIYKLFGKVPIQIGAQLYLKSFYESLGFKEVSPIYLEDGIEHIEMLRVEIPVIRGSFQLMQQFVCNNCGS